ncbi:MAG TPA: hypothetical protein VGI83_03920 [Gemmatimonadales bacterium]|jgi:hypothetical protein
MLRKFIGTAALVVAMAAPAMAQGGMGGQGRGGRDHWMTADSLIAAVGVTDSAAKAGVTMHLTELNAVYKARMDAMMAARNGGARPDSAAMAKWQTDAMTHYDAIGKLLNPAQKTKFDALTKPQLMGGRGGRRGGE